ncbi:MAG: PAS domain S-box protein [Deltaproteobacteria bacterium]|nr:PAS domain S-box protein [Deltaproteobacteria bacterium]
MKSTPREQQLELTIARLRSELATTTRALAERDERLRASETQYRLIFDKNPYPMWIFDPTTLGFLEVNEQAVHHYGYTREEFLAMTILDIRPPEEIPRVVARIEQARQPYALAFRLTGEWTHWQKDGTRMQVEAAAVSIAFNGRSAVLVLVNDITARSRMERELRRSEQVYRLLIDHFPNGVVALFDRDLRYRVVGGRGLMASGMTKERFEGKLMREVLPAHICTVLEPCYRQALAGKDALVEVPYLHRVLRVHTFPLPDDSDTIAVGIVVTQDITRQKRREEQLRRSGQRYRTLAQARERQLIASDRLVSFGELAASLAHELNNPLGIAMGFAQDLLSETATQDARYRRLQIIVEETRRCGQLMKNLLELAAPPRTTLVATDLAALVRHSLELISGQTQKCRVTTVCECAPDFPKVLADAQQLEQVLLNLYFNAIEAMPDGGTLTVQLGLTLPSGENTTGDRQSSTAEATITVNDTGQGIASADLPKIFHSFVTTKKQRGMGLGLSICESILRAHEGRIAVHSTPGQGTTFILHLPMRNAHDATV